MLKRLKNYPSEAPMTIAAGESYELKFGYQSCNFLRVAVANAAFRIRLDDTYEVNAAAGKKFNTSPENFSKVEVINTSGGNLTFQLEIGTGEISSDEVVISNTVNTSDANTLAAIQNMDANTQAALEEVEDLFKDDRLKRSPMTTLQGASYASQAGAGSQTLVTAGANVNGIIIRHALVHSTSASNAVIVSAGIKLNGNKFLWAEGTNANHQMYLTEKDIFVPPGQSLAIEVTGAIAYCRVDIYYEVL